METQANAPANAVPAQAQTPVHPIHQESQTLEKLTQWVKDAPDNDPHEGTDMEAPKGEPSEEPRQETKPEEQGETIEFDEETPFFELEYKSDGGVEKRKLSAKEIREGWLAKQDYHRNIQKVKQQESQLAEQMKQAELKAQHEYLQRLEANKQLDRKSVV